MEKFMTKVSDFISERRNNPEKRGSLLTFCMLGVVALIIVILCLLLLWQKKSGENEKEIDNEAETQEYTLETYEVKQEEVMASPEEEEWKQQYQTSIAYLEEKVEELLNAMTTIKETLGGVETTGQENAEGLQKQINEIMGDITQLVTSLQETRTQLDDLSDIVNVMQKESIPMIQEQMASVSSQITRINADITNLYQKISALETADEELRAKIDAVEGALKASIEQSMTEVTNKLQNMSTQIGDVQSQVQELAAQLLYYRYDAAENTLYLFPKE
ncbi:MAG: hypothetical protein PUD93_05080 [Lachnospiraceae bacterium]|nr:hypothetical protein [Lachnospiraceae bacterium]